MTENRDLSRLHKQTVLPNWLQPHMESARFLLADEPARKEHLAKMVAYIAIEQALQRQGQYIVVRMISRGLGTMDYDFRDVVREIKWAVERMNMDRRRVQLSGDRLTIMPLVCLYCALPENDHDPGTNKCLFAATSFVAKAPEGKPLEV